MSSLKLGPDLSGKPNKCELACPFICTVITVVPFVIGCIHLDRGWLVKPEECHSAKRFNGGDDFDKAWESLGVECYSLWNEGIPERQAGFRGVGETGRGADFDDCYAKACEKYCSDRLCAGEAKGIPLLIAGAISGCICLCCTTMISIKIFRYLKGGS
mmetsp:Transcript_16191/g.30161  ORF Transcript_16191/g.30161 Transcript_16191/m.30161 type:complete len:158 (-) Transcript_16191:147-620(-)